MRRLASISKSSHLIALVESSGRFVLEVKMNFQRALNKDTLGGGQGVNGRSSYIYNNQKQDNRKSEIYQYYRRRGMITNHELEAVLDDPARDICQKYPDPEDWEGWALYFFEAMEQ